MKIKIKKLLKESKIINEGYADIENVRISNGMAIDRSITTPAEQLDTTSGLTNADYVNRIRDIAKQGRKIPFLYYAYKGVDEKGKLLQNNNIEAVLDLQSRKASSFERKLELQGDASTLMFKCDFGLLMTFQDEWDEKYEQRMRDLMPSKSYERMALRKGYDRGHFQAGTTTNLKPFSTVAIGRGSKPLYAQNVDFMYKTSPEPNKNVDPSDIWAFSVKIPLAMAYLSISGVNPSYRQMASMGPQVISQAYSHWTQNEKEYRIQYAERMRQEGASWFQELPKLTFKDFNQNYVESTAAAKPKTSKEAEEAGTPDLSLAMQFHNLLMQGNSLSLITREGLIGMLEDPEEAKRISKGLINAMTKNKNDETKQTVIRNLQDLISKHKDDPVIQANMPWIQHAMQSYYVMGGS